jgi:hypothetical protein
MCQTVSNVFSDNLDGPIVALHTKIPRVGISLSGFSDSRR